MFLYSFLVLFAIFAVEYVHADATQKQVFPGPGAIATLKVIKWAFIGVWFYFLINPSALIPKN